MIQDTWRETCSTPSADFHAVLIALGEPTNSTFRVLAVGILAPNDMRKKEQKGVV